MRKLDTGDSDRRAIKRLEPHHRCATPLEGAVIQVRSTAFNPIACAAGIDQEVSVRVSRKDLEVAL